MNSFAVKLSTKPVSFRLNLEARNLINGYGNYQLEYRKSVKTNSCSLTYSDYQSSNPRNNSVTFKSNFPLQPKLSIESWLKDDTSRYGWKRGLHVISPYAISTAAISIVHTFNRLPFRPLANSTVTNSTYLIKFKFIQFFPDVRKQVK